MKRLIDTQDAFNVLTDYYHHHTSAQHLALQEALNKVPTVDAEPVRHAENIGTDYDEVYQFVCSECGIELQGWYRVERDEDDGVETIHEYRLRYCPNCGGKIVEKDAEPKEEPNVSKM